jgi:hypothetical protein
MHAGFTGMSILPAQMQVHKKGGQMPSSRQFDSDDIRARAIPREQVDLRKLSRALIELALRQAQEEADAEAEHQQRTEEDKPRAA